MHASDCLIEATEHLRLAKEELAAAHQEATAASPELWGPELTKVWLRVASLEEQVEELCYEF